MKTGKFRVINLDKKFYLKPDDYLNGWAKHCGWKATIAFDSLCRHADNATKQSFPSITLIAEEHGVSYNTIRRGLKTLEEWNIIYKEQKKGKSGKFLYNTYYILAKEHWKKPSPSSGLRKKPSPSPGNTVALPRAINYTHKKGTHIVDKSTRKITSAKKEFGKPEINSLISFLKEKMGIPMLDGSERENRRFCQLAINKFGGAEKVRLLIEATSQDKFWSTKIASFKRLYYNGVSIISNTRGVSKIYDASTNG